MYVFFSFYSLISRRKRERQNYSTKKTMISRTNLKRSQSPHPHHIPKPEKKSVVTEKVNQKKKKTRLADDSELFIMNRSLPVQISVDVITRRNESKNKKTIKCNSAKIVKMDCLSSQSKKFLSKKLQSEKKEKHEDIKEVFKKNRKSNRKRKVNKSDCYLYY